MTELNTRLTEQLIDAPNRPIIKDVSDNQWLTGQDFSQDVDQINTYLQTEKIGYHDQILVCLENRTVYPELMQAMWAKGIIAHPISATTPLDQLVEDWHEHNYAGAILEDTVQADFIEATGVKPSRLHLFTQPDLAILINTQVTTSRQQAPTGKVLETDLALILNTSGTTGKPKRVGLTQAMIFNAAKHNIVSQKWTDSDTTLILMPMFHINAQVISVLSTRLSGGKIVVARKFSASHFWQQVAENGVTWASVVPTILTILLINPNANQQYLKYRNQSKLRFVRSASFALPKDKLVAFQRRFNTQVLEGYGLTEAASQVTINPLDAPKVGSAGKAFATELQIYRNGEFTQIPGQTGEIAIRGDHVISTYLDPHTESFNNGWFMTGDMGYLDQDGYLFINGRIKEMISRGGEKVAPNKVEAALNCLDFIAEVSVVGLPDEVYGEAVTAVVILKDDATFNQAMAQTAIFDYAKQKLARFEQPTQIFFVNDLPRNPTGKVIRTKLRTQLMQTATGAAQ